MTIASHGYDGTLTEADFSRLMQLVGRTPVVGGSGDLAVTAEVGARAVVVAPGSAYAVGVRTDVFDTDGPNRLTLPTPTNGQFFLVVLRRDWAANDGELDDEAAEVIDGSSFEIIGADTTAATVPTAPPATLPAIAATPGVQFDQPLAWVWVTSASTAVTVWDLRAFPNEVERVPTLTARDGIPADRLWIGKRVLVEAEAGGRIYRRTAAAWEADGGTAETTKTQLDATPGTAVGQFSAAESITYRWDGTKWCPWESGWFAFTPTWRNLVTGTPSSPTQGGNLGRWRWQSGHVHVKAGVKTGTGGSISGTVSMSNLPKTRAVDQPVFDWSENVQLTGTFVLTSPDSAKRWHGKVTTPAGSRTASFTLLNTSETFEVAYTSGASANQVNATNPVAYADGWQLELDVMYEASDYPFARA